MTIPGSSDFDLVCVVAAQIRVQRGIGYPVHQAIGEALDIVTKTKRYFADAANIEDRAELRGYALPAWRGIDLEEKYQ